MPSSFHGINTGYVGLVSHQAALNTAGHNLANLNTEGYTRQRVLLAASYPYTMPGMQSACTVGQLGTGVQVTEIKQVRDQFLDKQLRSELPKQGEWLGKQYALDKLDTIFSETSDTSIRTVLNEFWSSLQELSNDPGSSTARSLVTQRGSALCDTISDTSNQLQAFRKELDELIGTSNTEALAPGQKENSQYSGVAGQINTIARQIADLNKQIKQIETDPEQNANDWRDQRNLLLDKLSKFINLSSTENADGTLDIAIGGQMLVDGAKSNTMGSVKVADPNSPGELYNELRWADGQKVQVTGGYLKGIIDARDVILPKYLNQVDEIAKGLYTGMNAMQSAGYSLNEEETDHNSSGHVDEFFITPSEKENLPHFAMKLTMNTALMGKVENLNKIAASSIASSASAGISNFKNGVNAQSMATMLQSAYIGGQLTLVGDTQNRFIKIDYTKTSGASQYPKAAVTATGIAPAFPFTATMNELLYTKNLSGAITAIPTTTDIAARFSYRQASGSTGGLATANYTVAGAPPVGTIQFNTSGAPIKGDTIVFSQAEQMYDADGNRYMPQSFTFNGEKWTASGVSDQAITLNSSGGQVVSAVNPRLTYVDGKLKAAITENGEDKFYDIKYEKGSGFEEYHRQMISMLGVEAGEADRMVNNSAIMTNKLEDLRQEVMGVSMDEEMTEMIKFQRGYSACARVVTTMDEMLDLIINRLGTVGR